MYGLSNFSWVGCLIVTLIVTHLTVMGVTIYLHRCQAHRSLDLHPAISHFFRLIVWMTTGQGTKAWVAIHRKHHSHCETEEDPHSPQVFGLKKVLLEGAELYRSEAKNAETLERYGKGTPDDWIENRLYTPHSTIGLWTLLALYVLFFGVHAITMWAVTLVWIPFWAAGVINGVGHYFGYRNYEVADASTNIVPWGILAGGEELHNNHHAFPLSAKLSVKWYEFDIAWGYIWTFQKLGLAKVHRIVPQLLQDQGKQAVDADSLAAILSNRIQVMDSYWRRVVRPVMREMKSTAPKSERNLYRSGAKLLIKDKRLITESEQAQLDRLLAEKSSLKTIYDFRLELISIWRRTTASQAELLESLILWCKQAEATGIKALQDFASQVRYYTAKQNA